MAADTIVKYIQSIRKIEIPKILIESIEISYTMRDTDDDIEKAMNLLFNIPDLEMGHPYFKIIKDSNTIQPKVLVVADNYYWGMFNWGLSKDVFDNDQFWYYNKQIYPDNYSQSTTVEDIDLKKEIEKTDVILLISTDNNLYKFAFGFIEQVYNIYFNES